MTQPSKILWFIFTAAMLLLLAGGAAAQSGTVTDDAFISTNAATQKIKLGGQGISLIVAGSSATVGLVPVGATTTCIKFQLSSSLPPNVAAARRFTRTNFNSNDGDGDRSATNGAMNVSAAVQTQERT